MLLVCFNIVHNFNLTRWLKTQWREYSTQNWMWCACVCIMCVEYAQLLLFWSVNRVCLRHSLVFHFKTMTAGYGDVCLLQVTSSHIFSSTFIQSFHSIFQITNAISFRIASFCGLSFVQFSCSQTRFFCLSGVMHRKEHHIFSLNRRKYTNKNLSTIKKDAWASFDSRSNFRCFFWEKYWTLWCR